MAHKSVYMNHSSTLNRERSIWNYFSVQQEQRSLRLLSNDWIYHGEFLEVDNELFTDGFGYLSNSQQEKIEPLNILVLKENQILRRNDMQFNLLEIYCALYIHLDRVD